MLALISLFAWFCLALSSAHAATNTFEFGEPPAGYSIARQVRYSFTVQNTKDTLLTNGEVRIRIPAARTAAQWCKRITASEPAELTADMEPGCPHPGYRPEGRPAPSEMPARHISGNRELRFLLGDMPPYGTKIIRVSADLDLAEKPQVWTARQSSTREDLPRSHGDTELERGVCGSSPCLRTLRGERSSEEAQSEAEEIVTLAKSLKAANPRETAKRIWGWVAENLAYSGYHKTNRGARWALKNRKGDCSEYAALFVEICRAADIPARAMSGFVCTENTILKPYERHDWAEFHDGKVWRISDPQKRVFDENPSAYMVFIVQEEKIGSQAGADGLFSFQGDGLKVRMEK